MHNEQDPAPRTTDDSDGTTPEVEPARETAPPAGSSTGDAGPTAEADAPDRNPVSVAITLGGAASESLAAADVDVWFAQSGSAATTSQTTTFPATEPQATSSPETESPAVAEEPIAGPVCPWCSKPIVSDASTCSSCGALLVPTDEEAVDSIPGVTEIDPRLRDYQPKPQKPQKLVDFLIQFVEEDEVAEAARQRLATKPKAKSKTKGRPSDESPTE